MRHFPFRRGVLLSLAAVLAAVGIAGTGQADAEGKLDNADRAFLAWDMQIEIQQQDMGRLAERRGQSPELRALGTYLVSQHQQAQAELQSVADRLGIRLSEVPSPTHLRVQRHYAAVPAESFDRAFVRHEVEDYRYFLSHFEVAAHAANSDIRRYVAAQLPRLREGQKRVEILSMTKLGAKQLAEPSRSIWLLRSHNRTLAGRI